MPSTLVSIESAAQEPAIRSLLPSTPMTKNSSSLTPWPPRETDRQTDRETHGLSRGRRQIRRRQHQAAVTRPRPLTVEEMPGTCDVSHVIGRTRTS